jgi:hypothetical protein
MWTDIGTTITGSVAYSVANIYRTDYMYKRRIFTVDPQYFPVNRVREIVNYLHSHDQQYGTG